MPRAVQLSSKSVEHYGPDYIGPMVREVFGCPINLDPASCAQANLLISAERYYTQADNGLVQPWEGTVYLNPPGPVSNAARWYATLAVRYAAGSVTQAVFMIFNPEMPRFALRWDAKQPLEFLYCIPRDRIDFWKPGEYAPQRQGAPGHCNIIIYMGPHTDRFRSVFTEPCDDWSGGRVFGC